MNAVPQQLETAPSQGRKYPLDTSSIYSYALVKVVVFAHVIAIRAYLTVPGRKRFEDVIWIEVEMVSMWLLFNFPLIDGQFSIPLLLSPITKSTVQTLPLSYG